MSAVAETDLIAIDELAALTPSGRFELIEGKLIPTSPTGDMHGGYELTAAMLLRQFANAHNLGKVRCGEVGIIIRRDPDTVRAADALLFRTSATPRGSRGATSMSPPSSSSRSCRRAIPSPRCWRRSATTPASG